MPQYTRVKADGQPLMSWFMMVYIWANNNTLPETNIAHENPIFPGKYHQNDGFSTAMLVYRSVIPKPEFRGV